MSTKIIVLKSSDNEYFEVQEAVALQSQTLAHMIEDDCANNAIPLANVSSRILVKVIEYCKKHAPLGDEPLSEEMKEELKTWDATFMHSDIATLYEVMNAAHFLCIQGLVDLTCQTVANMLEGKTPDEIRRTFNIPNDFSPEEEAQLEKEIEWVFK